MTKQHFIADQGWSLLTEFDNPKAHIDRIQVRTTTVPHFPGDGMDLKSDPWVPIDDHYDLLGNRLNMPELGHIDLSRFVFTTDSGLGKSIAIEWIHAGTNHPSLSRVPAKADSQSPRSPALPIETSVRGWIAFNVPRHVLTDGSPEQVHQRLWQYMIDTFRNQVNDSACGVAMVRQHLERHRKNGRMLLLFDGLDHLNSATALQQILRSDIWKPCSIGLGGRPYAINRFWNELFANEPRWRFIKLEQFTVEQQKSYLTEEKWEAVNQQARHLLAIPRILKYVQGLSKAELGKLRTASDVFYSAIKSLIVQGLESAEARQITGDETVSNTPSQGMIESAFRLLSAIAFEMVSEKRQDPIIKNGDVVGHEPPSPNFGLVEEGEMATFKQKVQDRAGVQRNFDRCWNGLSALNNGLLNAFFDDQVAGLKQVQFSNKGLQEFLCAYWLSQYAGLDSKGRILQGANDFLWDWIYLPFEPDTHAYYDIWMYLTEMATEGIKPAVWLESIAPLYSRPRLDSGKWVVKRSNEMVFRSWNRLDSFLKNHPRALAIRDGWWSEFESEILSGNRGDELKSMAMAFQDDLMELPGGNFMMGSPPGSTGKLEESTREFYQRIIDGAPQDPNQLPEYIKRELQSDRWTFSHGRAGDQQRAEWELFLIDVCQGGGISMVEQQFVDRTDEHWHEVTVDNFQLGRSPCLNEWYRLFDPGHGRQAVIQADYQEYSLAGEQPVIFVQWFDAWAFCQWARWGHQSCQLPSEAQWEYAAKFGVNPKWEYWWEGDFDPRYCNARLDVGTTTKPDPAHVNPKTKEIDRGDRGKKIGLMDMLGNVNEWCRDVYEPQHSAARAEELGDAQSSRCLRGGSFLDGAAGCRCADPTRNHPIGAGQNCGFRVARAK